MLALTREELAPTDTTDRAIDAIAGSGIREIVLLARRGPAQAAFTTPELKELGELAGADVVVDPAELELDAASASSLEGNTNATRNMEVLREFASREPTGKPRRIVLRFLVSPVAILGEDQVEGVEIVQNELVAEGERISARATDQRETIPAGIVFRSVGYRGVALPGLPFDEARGTLLNDGGRVLDESGEPLAGVYCAGWIKRGPTGVIGTNKKDATETVKLLLEDAAAGRLRGRRRSRATSPRCWPSGAASRSSTPAGRRSTASRRPPESRTAVRGSSSTRWEELLARTPRSDGGRMRRSKGRGNRSVEHRAELAAAVPETEGSLKRIFLALAVAMLVLLPASASAITDGELDGNRHPYVGLMVAQTRRRPAVALQRHADLAAAVPDGGSLHRGARGPRRDLVRADVECGHPRQRLPARTGTSEARRTRIRATTRTRSISSTSASSCSTRRVVDEHVRPAAELSTSSTR